MQENSNIGNLTNLILTSQIFKQSLTDQKIQKKLEILKETIGYVIKKNNSDLLKDHLKKRFDLNGNLEIWVKELSDLKEEINSIYSTIKDEKEGISIQLRGLYPEIIAEVLYTKYKEKIDYLKI